MGLLDSLMSAYQSGMSLLVPNQKDVEMRPQIAKGLLGVLPGSGDAIAGYDAMQSAKEGNYGEAALNGVGLLPFVPAMGGMIKPLTPFTFIRNTEKAGNFGKTFAQDIEPAGRYLLEDTGGVANSLPKNWISGTHTFKNPMMIEWGGEYGTPTNWKSVLSEKYGGKTGKALSKAIVKDGYDGVVTLRNGDTSEVVDLSSFIK